MNETNRLLNKINILIICTATIFISSPLWAVPSITNVAGKVSHGSSITISGSGFGTKSPAAPILWDTFDDGSNGAKISTRGRWTNYNSGATYSNTRPYSGTLSAYSYVEYGDRYPAGFNTNNYFLPTPTDQIYITFMFRHDGTAYTTGVDKNWRINTGNNQYHGDGTVALSDGYVYYTSGSNYVYPSDDNGTGRKFSIPEYGSSTWTRHQGYIRYSNPSGNSNGYIWVAVGNQQKTFANINNRPSGYNYKATNVLLGLMHDCGSLNPGEYHHMYIDDVYIDNTLSRVEIGNASTWAACTLKVIQIPTAWADNTVLVKVNHGSFTEMSNVWLYVIDSNGNANANGFPIKFENAYGGDTTPPNSPVGISVQFN